MGAPVSIAPGAWCPAQAPRVGRQHFVLPGTFLMPQGTGCWSQLPSLCSCPCRAPGDEEAQAENLIASNGKAPAPCTAPLRACCWPSTRPWAGGICPRPGSAAPLLFPLQQREHRKQRTEAEPCGESQPGGGHRGCHSLAVHGDGCRAPPVCSVQLCIPSTGLELGQEKEKEAPARIFPSSTFPSIVLPLCPAVLFAGLTESWEQLPEGISPPACPGTPRSEFLRAPGLGAVFGEGASGEPVVAAGCGLLVAAVLPCPHSLLSSPRRPSDPRTGARTAATNCPPGA